MAKIINRKTTAVGISANSFRLYRRRWAMIPLTRPRGSVSRE
jgi:hypothetical protein